MSVEREASGEFLVKLQSELVEVNVRASMDELLRLQSIRSARWAERGSIQAGESAGAPAYWCSNGETASLMIGHDDETWDVNLTIPLDAVDTIVADISSDGPRP